MPFPVCDLIPALPDVLERMLAAVHGAKKPSQSDWQFAVTMDEIRQMGLDEIDLRWLCAKGYFRHLVQMPAGCPSTETLHGTSVHRFSRRSCFTLTDLGERFARSLFMGSLGRGETAVQRNTPRIILPPPIWKPFALEGERRQTEVELKGMAERLADDLMDLIRLHQVSARLVLHRDLQQLLDEVLDAAMAITGCDMGAVGISESVSGTSKTFSQRGFDPAFGGFLESLHDPQAILGKAMLARERVIFEDLTKSSFIAGTPLVDAVLAAGGRAAQFTPLVSQSGEIVGTLATFFRAPGAPEKGELGLLDILADQAADFIERSQAEESLRQANRQKDEFLAMLSHELRNPLGAIQYAVEISKQGLGKEAEIIDNIGHQVKHLTHLIDDLLDVARITQGKIQLDSQPVSAADIIRQAVATVRPLIESCQHQLAVHVAPEAMPLMGDPTRFQQILVNLLSNAAKYTPKGGQIRVSAVPEEGQAIIRIADNGVGISQHMLARIFDPFSQVDPSLNHSRGGLGIGLTIARTLVQMHGGYIVASSEGVGRGSEFMVRLPLAAPASETNVRTPSQASSQKLRILSVDDNEAAS